MGTARILVQVVMRVAVTQQTRLYYGGSGSLCVRALHAFVECLCGRGLPQADTRIADDNGLLYTACVAPHL